jgi:hypothetical protein
VKFQVSPHAVFHPVKFSSPAKWITKILGPKAVTDQVCALWLFAVNFNEPLNSTRLATAHHVPSTMAVITKLDEAKHANNDFPTEKVGHLRCALSASKRDTKWRRKMPIAFYIGAPRLCTGVANQTTHNSVFCLRGRRGSIQIIITHRCWLAGWQINLDAEQKGLRFRAPCRTSEPTLERHCCCTANHLR